MPRCYRGVIWLGSARRAMGGKTGKTAVLPRFCKIERGGIGFKKFGIANVPILDFLNLFGSDEALKIKLASQSLKVEKCECEKLFYSMQDVVYTCFLSSA